MRWIGSGADCLKEFRWAGSYNWEELAWLHMIYMVRVAGSSTMAP